MGQCYEEIRNVMILLRQERKSIQRDINAAQNEYNQRLRRMENLISYPNQERSSSKIEQTISDAVPAALIPPASPLVPAAVATDASGKTEHKLNLEKSAWLLELVTRSGNNG